MSKKKFTDGLESLFGEPTEKEVSLKEDSPLLVETKEEKARPVVRRERRRVAKRSSSKNFTSDLDSLFEDALQETLEEKANKVVKSDTKAAPRRRRQLDAPVSGLDALIRRTVESSIEVERGVRKRVSFIFDKEKLIRLKQIAKQENSYLKDIIGDVMAKFIEKYEREHGSIDNAF